MPLANRIYDHFGLLQDRILARLTVADPALDRVVRDWPNLTTANGAGIPFMTERVGDFANTLTKNLNNVSGLAGIVLTPTARVDEPTDGTFELTAPVVIQVQENVTINMRGRDADAADKKGTQVPALMLVQYVMRRLHGFCHQLYGGEPEMSRVLLDKKAFTLLKATNPVVYNIAFTAPIDLAARLPDEFDDLLFDDGSVVNYA
jgi:hypothetical protein